MKDFDRIIWRNGLTLIGFFSTRRIGGDGMRPVLDRFETRMAGRMELYRIDIDDPGIREVLHQYSIIRVPTLLFFRRGEVLWRSSGMLEYEALTEVLNRLEARDYVPIF